MTNLPSLLLAFICLLASSALPAQTQSDLQAQQNRLQAKIKLTNSLIQKNSQSQARSVATLDLLHSKLLARKRLLNSYKASLTGIKSDQDRTKYAVADLKKRQSKLETTYGRMLSVSYRSKLTNNRWLFLLSSASINQLFLRWRYLHQISKTWAKQLEKMQRTKLELEIKETALIDLAIKKSSMLQMKEQEQAQLTKDESKHSSLLGHLEDEGSRLEKERSNQAVAKRKLHNAIEAMIAANTNTTSLEEMPLAPAMVKLAASFKANRGQLPWPVEKGIITASFGKHQHPTLRNVTTNNNGIDIKTVASAEVRAIYSGTVVGHQLVPGYQHMIILSHGSYYTVYSYLKDVVVEKGQKIKANEWIGTAKTDNGTGQVHLEIWSGKELMDPKKWLMSQ